MEGRSAKLVVWKHIDDDAADGRTGLRADTRWSIARCGGDGQSMVDFGE